MLVLSVFYEGKHFQRSILCHFAAWHLNPDEDNMASPTGQSALCSRAEAAKPVLTARGYISSQICGSAAGWPPRHSGVTQTEGEAADKTPPGH